MSFSLDLSLPRPLYPVAWMIGSWEGAGVALLRDAAGAETSRPFRQHVEFAISDSDESTLSYACSTRLDDGTVLLEETGFWTVVGPSDGEPPVDDDHPAASVQHDLDVVLAHPRGIADVYVGRVQGPRVDLATDLVARTRTGAGHTAATRMYGLVDSKLMWAYDLATEDRPLGTYLSAELNRG